MFSKSVLKIGVLFTVIWVFGKLVFPDFQHMSNGDYVYQIESPNHIYRINVYQIIGGHATVANAYRCEVENIKTKFNRNLYYDYTQTDIDIMWKSDYVVQINDICLDVRMDYFDRKDYVDESWKWK